MKPPFSGNRAALRIIAGYVLFSLVWIAWSDRALAKVIVDPQQLVDWSIYKGFAFVAFSAFFLYFLLSREKARREEVDLRYRRLFESAKDGILILDAATGMIVDVNPFLIELLGFSREEFLGKTIWELGFFKDLVANQAAFAELQQAEYIRYEDKALEGHDGRRHEVEFISNVFAVNSHKVIQCNIRDNTAHNQAAKAQRKAETQYRSLFEHMLNGFAYCRMIYADGQPCDFEYLAVNAAFETLTGLKNVVGRRASEVIPGLFKSDAGLVARYACVAETGVVERFETYVEALQLWFSIAVYCPEKGYFVALFDVITARKQAEATLQANEEKFRAIANYTVDWESWFGPDGKYRWVNPAVERFTGYTPAEVLALPDFIAVLIAPEDRAAVRDRLQYALQGNRVVDFEFRYLHKTGTKLWLSASGQPIYDTQGKALGVRVSGRDITLQKQAETALRESEEQFRVMFESASIGMAQADLRTGQWQRVNPKMCAITGYSAAELLQMRVPEITHPEDRAKDWENFQRVVRGAAPDYRMEKRYLRKDGAVAWVNVNMTVIRDDTGQPLRTMATIEDITERKQAETQLRLNTTALKSAANAIVITDTMGTIIWVNPAFTRLTGYQADEAIGQNPRVLKSGQHPPAFYADLWRTVTAGKSWHGELVNRRKDGAEYTEEMTITPVRDATGAVTHFIAIKQDVTDRKRTETALLESNRQLGQTLAQLQVAQKQMVEQERLHALGQMASGIAHDFNNALSPILGFSELLLHRPEKSRDPATVTNFLQMINTCAKDATHVVRRLREFYRHRERGEVFLPVNVNHLLMQTVDLTQPRWKEQTQAAGIQIDVQSELGNIPHIYCDESELREMLTNLIFNAVDAMPAGGTITVRTRPEGDRVLLEISDTGTGMTDEVRRRCLEPFYSTKGERGTGLGLAMVYGVVQRHEGSLDIRSELGKGTTFAIHFPIEAPARAPAALAKVATTTRRLRVLVVDDEQMVLDVVTDYLTGDGHSVATATGGHQALAKFARAQFDLVITDRSMPGGSGEELAAALKVLQPQMPVIMLTGFGAIMEATADCPKGVDVLLSKPVTLHDLQQAVARICPAAKKETTA